MLGLGGRKEESKGERGNMVWRVLVLACALLVSTSGASHLRAGAAESPAPAKVLEGRATDEAPEAGAAAGPAAETGPAAEGDGTQPARAEESDPDMIAIRAAEQKPRCTVTSSRPTKRTRRR